MKTIQTYSILIAQVILVSISRTVGYYFCGEENKPCTAHVIIALAFGIIASCAIHFGIVKPLRDFDYAIGHLCNVPY